MRVNYARNAGRPWAVRILLDGVQPRAPRQARAMPFDDPPSPGSAAPGETGISAPRPLSLMNADGGSGTCSAPPSADILTPP